MEADFDEVGVGVGGEDEDVGHFAIPVDGLGAAVDFEVAVGVGLEFAGFAEVDELSGGAVGMGIMGSIGIMGGMPDGGVLVRLRWGTLSAGESWDGMDRKYGNNGKYGEGHCGSLFSRG